MKYKPIIMGADSVRAILEGRKTMTRRVVKPQPDWEAEVRETVTCGDLVFPIGSHGGQCGAPLLLSGKKDVFFGIRNPYGKIGDRLWVRETFRIVEGVTINGIAVIYKANCSGFALENINNWKSPLFMPRWASRITLEITDIRVERLQDITEEDADAELFGGYEPRSIVPEIFNDDDSYKTIPECFGKFWDYINAKRGYPWESKPWVWVISFKRVHDQKEG